MNTEVDVPNGDVNQNTPPFTRKKRFTWRRFVLGGIVAGVLFALIAPWISLPYYVFSPGEAIGVSQYVEVPPDKAHPPKGDVLLTTVSLVRANPLVFLQAWFSSGYEIESKSSVLGTATPEQYLQANQQSMDDSKMVATYVAMRRAGYDVHQLGDGALVDAVAPNAPAIGKLNKGDTIVGINGVPVKVSTDVTGQIRPMSLGSVVHLDVVDGGGHTRTEDVTVAARPDGASGVYVGVAIETKNPHLDTPFPVKLTTTKIGGPSAGLAFTLALLDDLTPGELTGGQNIAVTGTIASDGTVGPVGGVTQKTYAVRQSGAKLFLVPPDEYEEAKAHAGKKLKVLKINTLDEALTALRDNGGDPVMN